MSLSPTQSEKFSDEKLEHSGGVGSRRKYDYDSEEYKKADKALIWKMDKNLVPFITLLYLMSFLDRVNIGVAKLAGITTDLSLTSLQFNTASMVFFVSYVFFEVPSNLVLKKFKPSRFIPCIMFVWGGIQLAMGFVKDYGQLIVCRFLLGLFESALFPGLCFYLATWYKPTELNIRISIFFCGAVLAGAFGGALGYGFSLMAGLSGLAGWQWIFIIEGLLTMVIAITAIWGIQDFPADAKFLTEDERARVFDRIQRETGTSGQGEFDWLQIKRALSDPKTWLFMTAYIGVAEPLYSLSLFSPTIIAALGKWTTPQSLLLSVPPYALGVCTALATAFLSDRLAKRYFFLLGWAFVAIIGYVLLLTVPISNPGVLYFAVFLCIGAVAPGIVCTISWTANSFTNHYKKATSMGMVFTMGNSGGIVASQIYRTEDAPRFALGQGTTLGFVLLGLCSTTALYFIMRKENRRRDELYGTPEKRQGDFRSEEETRRLGLEGMTVEDEDAMGDYHPAYRYIL